MRVTLFRDHPAEGWPSMDRYAKSLLAGLQQVASADWCFEMPMPPAPWPGSYGQLLRRSVWYPFWAPHHKGHVNHILDHSYGHLLFSLDPAYTIVTVHDVAPLRFPGRQLGLSLLAWQLAWRGVQRARHVIVDSTFIARELRGYLALSPDRLHIVPLGVSPAFRPQPTEKQKAIRQLYVSENGQLLLHVGHTQARKNLPTLLKALALLRQQGREVTLVQIGGRSSRSQRELLSDLGLETVVHFLGHLPDEQLAAFYSAADAFVLPSLYEGFGLPVLEAMACGTPVVASNVASLPDVVGDAGLLVEPSSADSWAETIAQVLADSGFAAQLRERGLERVRQFTWERTASETLGVYTQMRGRIDS